MSEILYTRECDGFHEHSTRSIEVKGTDTGTIVVSVTTRWGKSSSDTSQVAITPDELAEINQIVNTMEIVQPPPQVDSKVTDALAEAMTLLEGMNV